MKLLVKQPAETARLPMEFGGIATISDLVGVTSEARGLVPGAIALAAEGQLFAGALTLELTGGSDGERYLVTVTVDDAEGSRVEQEVEVAVLDLAWAMPDGGAPMLSIAEFVGRFGLNETVRMTDEAGDGRIGRDLLVGALRDAQALVETALSNRYALPLYDVPHVVKTMIGDIARGRLYPGGAPDGIAEQVKAAMRLLERIEDGKTNLGIAVPSAPADSGDGISFYSGRRAYPDSLSDY